MSQTTTIALDTSIQIERIIGATAQQATIEQHLSSSQYHFVTSQYVFMEFQRSVWADYVRVYNAILQHTSWTDTAQALRSGRLAFRPRAMGRCLQILTLIMATAHLERENALDLLDSQIRYDLPLRFWRHVDPLPDPISCDLIEIGVAQQVDTRFTIADVCRKETAACQLPHFLESRQAELKAIAEYLLAHPEQIKNQERAERLIQAVLGDPNASLGQSACWPLGDLIILMQTPPDAQFWTLDADFQVLAQVLGVELYQPSAAERE